MMKGRHSQKLKIHIPSFFIFLLFFFINTSYAKAFTVSEIEIEGLYSVNQDELLYLLDIEIGKEIDPETIKSGIKRSFLKDLFEDIEIYVTNGEKTKVLIKVKEKELLEDVNIIVKDNPYGISKKIIKNLFDLKEGDHLKCNIIKDAIKKLKHDLAIRGFTAAIINSEIKKLDKPYRVQLDLFVEPGPPEIIKKIIISGINKELKSAMRLTEGDVFDQTILKKDLERIKSKLKKSGYFRPVVGPYEYSKGLLNISINPGTKLVISIEGNENVSKKTIMNTLPFFDAEDFSDALIEEAVHRILSIYYSKGFPFAQIAPVITTKNDSIFLSLFIFEGRRVKVGSISFVDNTLPEKSLKEIMTLKEEKVYNPELLNNDLESIKAIYNSLGYLSAEIEEFETKYDETTDTMDIVIHINEGVKTVIKRIDIIGTNSFSEEKIRDVINIKEGDAYNEVDISDARFKIIDLYNSSGFPDVNVTVERSFEAEKAFVTFKIDEGNKTFFGKTIITGNQNTRYKVIRRELYEKENTPFNYSLLSKERQNLYRLGLFTDIDVEVLDRYDHKKDILMRLNEGNAGTLELSIGYAEYEQFRGVLELSYRNLFGMNRRGSLKLELSSLEKRFILQYYEPWFLSRNLPLRIFFLSENKKEINIDTRETRYQLTRHTVTAGLEKKLNDNLKSELFYEFSLVNTYDVKPDVILSREDTGTLIISGLRFGLIYDTRDSPFYPKKGILSGASLKLTGPMFLSETDFIKFSIYSNFYRELTKDVVLAASLRGGFAQGYNKTRELPIVERFFLGGRNTVRGYDQDTLGPKGSDRTPTGGNIFIMENLELRTSIGKGIGLVAFLDGGNVWINIEDLNIRNLKFTTGIGVRYNTPVGPLRIDYGYKLEREKDESSGEIHFSIGHAF